MQWKPYLAAVTLLLSPSLNAEEVTIRALPNAPVNYLLEIHADSVHNVRGETSDLGKTNIILDLNAVISQKNGAPTELIITPLSANYLQKGLGFTFAFDSKQIPSGDSPLLRSFRDFWGKAIHLPLTTDVDYLNQNSEFFRMLPPENQESYLAFVENFLNYLANGEHYRTDEQLWHLEFKTADNQIQSDGKVASITPKKVILDITFSGHSSGIPAENESEIPSPQQKPLTISVNAQAEKSIDRANALFRNLHGKAFAKISSEALEDSLFRGGDLEVSIRFNLTSKSAITDIQDPKPTVYRWKD